MIDWSILPPELDYLREPAEKYGRYQMHHEVLGFLQSATDEDYAALRQVADEIRARDDEATLDYWLEKYFLNRYEAATFVYFMLVLLDELDYSIRTTPPATNVFEYFQRKWQRDHYHSFALLAEETREHLPFEEGRALVVEGLKRVPRSKLNSELFALEEFPTDRNLDWIEQNICRPINDFWGSLAAVSHISWPRIEKWLNQGRPLSQVALDALRCCWKYDRENLQRYRPKLRQPAPPERMTQRLLEYQRADPDPRVAQRVEKIIRHWDDICEVPE